MKRKVKSNPPLVEKDQWELATADSVLSMHPNIEVAQLSALFHVKNGESITWEDRRLPLDVAALIGSVNGKDKFVICRSTKPPLP